MWLIQPYFYHISTVYRPAQERSLIMVPVAQAQALFDHNTREEDAGLSKLALAVVAHNENIAPHFTVGQRLYLPAKRFFDIVFSALGLIALSPLFLLVSLAIKLDSKGSVFFTQERVGKRGETFKMFKFRSMVTDAEAQLENLRALNEKDGPVFKMSRDPRQTKVGHFLRKTSLDELPQLANVLLGQMSLVGPRPPLAQEVAQYSTWQKRRLGVTPGLTCYWQVSGRSNISFDQWVRMDIQYIKDLSFWTDLKILFKTIPAVLRGVGAY